MTSSTETLPVIDIGSLRRDTRDLARIGAALDEACCEFGFFYITGHGISPALSARLMTLARKFFDSPLEQKMTIAMAHGGRAWRGYFPVDGELTSGLPIARKESTSAPNWDPTIRGFAPAFRCTARISIRRCPDSATRCWPI